MPRIASRYLILALVALLAITPGVGRAQEITFVGDGFFVEGDLLIPKLTIVPFQPATFQIVVQGGIQPLDFDQLTYRLINFPLATFFTATPDPASTVAGSLPGGVIVQSFSSCQTVNTPAVLVSVQIVALSPIPFTTVSLGNGSGGPPDRRRCDGSVVPMFAGRLLLNPLVLGIEGRSWTAVKRLYEP